MNIELNDIIENPFIDILEYDNLDNIIINDVIIY